MIQYINDRQKMELGLYCHQKLKQNLTLQTFRLKWCRGEGLHELIFQAKSALVWQGVCNFVKKKNPHEEIVPVLRHNISH